MQYKMFIFFLNLLKKFNWKFIFSIKLWFCSYSHDQIQAIVYGHFIYKTFSTLYFKFYSWPPRIFHFRICSPSNFCINLFFGQNLILTHNLHIYIYLHHCSLTPFPNLLVSLGTELLVKKEIINILDSMYINDTLFLDY